jgi:hypothetical protein
MQFFTSRRAHTHRTHDPRMISHARARGRARAYILHFNMYTCSAGRGDGRIAIRMPLDPEPEHMVDSADPYPGELSARSRTHSLASMEPLSICRAGVGLRWWESVRGIGGDIGSWPAPNKNACMSVLVSVCVSVCLCVCMWVWVWVCVRAGVVCSGGRKRLGG